MNAGCYCVSTNEGVYGSYLLKFLCTFQTSFQMFLWLLDFGFLTMEQLCKQKHLKYNMFKSFSGAG